MLIVDELLVALRGTDLRSPRSDSPLEVLRNRAAPSHHIAKRQIESLKAAGNPLLQGMGEIATRRLVIGYWLLDFLTNN